MCPHCGKRFTAWRRYQNHVKSHDYEKPYKCNQCSEEFNFEVSLTGTNRELPVDAR